MNSIKSTSCTNSTSFHSYFSLILIFFSLLQCLIADDGLSQTRVALCEIGHYCISDIQHPCPSGRFGEVFNESSSECSGICEEGYFCSAGSTISNQFVCGGSSVYCPLNSSHPTQVNIGHYSVGGNTSYTRTHQKISPKGYYASNGILYACPAGRFGSRSGIFSSSCSGSCHAGFYCPEASTSAFQFACGGNDRVCPASSYAPISVSKGFYTSSSFSKTIEIGSASHHVSVMGSECAAGQYRNTSIQFRPDISHSESNAFVPVIDIEGVCVACPPGRFKVDDGNELIQCKECDSFTTISPIEESLDETLVFRTTCLCDGKLPNKDLLYEKYSHFISLLTEQLNANQVISDFNTRYPDDAVDLFFNYSSGSCESMSELIANRKLDESNSELQDIDFLISSDLFLSTSSSLTRISQEKCEAGFFCVNGVRFACSSGRYGSNTQLSDSACSGICQAGYYCPTASNSSRMFPCGGVDRYCPSMSSVPLPVSIGYYTDEDEPENTKSRQFKCPPGYYCENGVRIECPAGRFASLSGLDSENCENECEKGFYCTNRSSSSRQYSCGGPDAYCIPGSTKPTAVSLGYYSIHTGPEAELMDKVTDVSGKQMSAQIVCEPGHYCVDGVKKMCAAGRYGWRYQETSQDCSGMCTAGYMCGEQQTTAVKIPCGSVDVYCPKGTTLVPISVDPGHYTTGGNERTRTGQNKCEVGYYCFGGERFPCPIGRFGAVEGLQTVYCSGTCPSGYFCPKAASEPTECDDGYYSTGGIGWCTPCPGRVNEETASLRCRNSRNCCFV